MKAILTALTFVASTAFAGSVTYQTIGGVPANNLCDAGSVFKTKSPVFVCDSWVEVPGFSAGEAEVPASWKCVSGSNKDLAISKDIEVCENIKVDESTVACTAKKAGIQSSTVLVSTDVTGKSESDLKYSNYTIPACE